MSQTVLETRQLSKAYGGLKVLTGIDFQLKKGERHAVIGPNGAGKSTFVALISGLIQPTNGSIWLQGKDITHQTVQQRVAAGLGRTFQINTLFAQLNPLESVVLALCQRDGLAKPSFKAIKHLQGPLEEAAQLLQRFGLDKQAFVPTQSLPYGQQRVLEVVLAYAQRPQVLLLDEPAAGLTTAQGHELFEQLSTLSEDTTLLFIEHDMNLVFRYAKTVSVLAGGSVLAQGSPDQVRSDPAVRKAYLGH